MAAAVLRDDRVDDGLRDCIRWPQLFARGVLQEDLWSMQRRVLRGLALRKKVAAASCHMIGKTRLAADAAVWFMMTHRPAICVTTAPTWVQVRDLLWKEINQLALRLPTQFRTWGMPNETRWKLGPGHFAYGLSTDRIGRFQGQHSPHLMVIADEACEVSDEIFTAIDTLGAEYELLIGNPTNAEGKFYRAFSNPSLGYARYQIPASITPNFTREQIPAHVARQLVSPALVAQWGNDWGAESPLYRSRVLARFPEQDSSVILVPQHWFTYAANRVESQLGKRPAVQLGFDVAHGAPHQKAA
jgi:hypothetical protein